jgi:hypothetical protein
MPEQTSPPPHPVHASEIADSLDRRIALLRRSLEDDSPNGNVGARNWAGYAKRRGLVALATTFRQGSRLIRAHRFEIRVYGAVVAVSLVIAWLISSHLAP